MNSTPVTGDDTRTGYASPPIRLDAGSRIVARAMCWRGDCRKRFGEYRTIAHLADGRVVAWCHRRSHDDLAYRADVWKFGQVAA